MNKVGVVLGVAVVAAFAGCKNPEYSRRQQTVQNEGKDIVVETEKPAPAPAVEETKTCTCPPGTKHTSPCKCAAPNCRCVVVAPAPKPAPAPVEPEYTTYIVQRGDYLAKISKRYNVTIAAIRKLNPSIKKDVVRIGQKIKLPGKVDVGVQRTPAAAPVAVRKKAAKAYVPYTGATREYVVKSGDSLGAIAYGNGITIRQLKELNSLKSDRLSIGQKLKIPATKVKAAAVAKKPEPVVEKKPAVEKVEAPKQEAEKKVESEPVAVTAESATTNVAPAADSAEAPAAAAPSTETAAPAATPATETYVVQEGDDMTGVSIRWGVSAAAIRELNNLGDNDQLKPGQIIKLPAEAQQ